jgi:hypothetical protein
MTIEQIRGMHQARPFQPFEIHLAKGRTLPFEHPEFLAQSPTRRTIGVGRLNGTIEIVDLLLFVSLKQRPRSSTRCGRRRGSRPHEMDSGESSYRLNEGSMPKICSSVRMS